MVKIYEKIFDKIIDDMKLKRYCERNNFTIDIENKNEKLLGISYYYAKQNNLKDYQARSFASELTAILTKRIYDTGVSLIYNETRLDNYLFKKYGECGNLKEFIEFMLKFYKSQKSWKFERVGKYLQFKVSNEEKDMFKSLPPKKLIDKFNWLLQNYDYKLKNFEYERKGKVDTVLSINIGTSQYDEFMKVKGVAKTRKFLNLLYYGYALNEY